MMFVLLATVLSLLGTVPSPEAGQEPGWNFNLRTPDGRPPTSCDDLEVTIRSGELVRGEDVVSPPATPSGLSVRGFRNGGLYASGSGAGDYAVKLCKFAAGRTAGEAQAVLDAVTLGEQGGVVRVNGPDERSNWTAHLIVLTPENARVELETLNGPLSVSGVTGRITARATNGPVAVKGSSGEIRIEAQNGPVSLSETSGDVRAVANNGPLAVALSGGSWQGAGLDGRANNGPLSLRVPDGYQSGVAVEMSRHSPLNCRGAICTGAVRLGGDSGTLRLGSDPAQVRLSAHNGPVSISSGRD
jgi:hypothetical protein